MGNPSEIYMLPATHTLRTEGVGGLEFPPPKKSEFSIIIINSNSRKLRTFNGNSHEPTEVLVSDTVAYTVLISLKIFQRPR